MAKNKIYTLWKLKLKYFPRNDVYQTVGKDIRDVLDTLRLIFFSDLITCDSPEFIVAVKIAGWILFTVAA